MKHSFNCAPLSASLMAEPLVFTWNPDTGEVEGPDAELVRRIASEVQVPAHPRPWAWELSADPLRSWVDMAAIVGSEWVLPAVLREHYPRYEAPTGPTDENGDPLPGFVN